MQTSYSVRAVWLQTCAAGLLTCVWDPLILLDKTDTKFNFEDVKQVRNKLQLLQHSHLWRLILLILLQEANSLLHSDLYRVNVLPDNWFNNVCDVSAGREQTYEAKYELYRLRAANGHSDFWLNLSDHIRARLRPLQSHIQVWLLFIFPLSATKHQVDKNTIKSLRHTRIQMFK